MTDINQTQAEQEASSQPPTVRPRESHSSVYCGQAAVPWAAATRTGAPLFQSMKAGWALPGGARTQDREHAFFVAQEISRLMAANTAKPS